MEEKKTLLVSGALGFIGYHTIKLLSNCYNVVGIDNFANPIMAKERLELLKGLDSFTFINCDILDKERLESVFSTYNFSQVVHLAALAGVQPSISNPTKYVEVNVNGFQNVLEACRAHKITKVTYASSSSIYALESPYAASKAMCESLAEAYSNCYSMNIVGLRFFTVYGEYWRKDMAFATFTKAIDNGNSVTLYDNCHRAFTYVGDIAKAINLVVGKTASGHKVYDVGVASVRSVLDLAFEISKRLGKPLEFITAPRRVGDARVIYPHFLEFEEDYGFRPSVQLEEGVGLVVDWYLEHSRTSLEPL